jgi:molybdopterin molybdotransferase
VGAAETKVKPLEWEEARQTVVRELQSAVGKADVETVSLEAAHGRVLAADVRADRDYPTLDRSLRDGFAVRSADLPGTLRVIGELRAGENESAPLQPGHALEIMTGAPVPAGADAVVMVEHVTRSDGEVTISQQSTATLAMTGNTQVSVHVKPSVAILSTGDELVEVADVPGPHQIRNSNSYALATLVNAAGGVAAIQPMARDTEADLLNALECGLEHDLLLITGGVSAGKYDLVKPCLKKLGAAFFFERVRIQPGQPTAFGRVGSKFVFGLPGNPGSSMVTFQLFASAAVEMIAGVKNPLLPLFGAPFAAPFKHKLGLTRFLPARLDSEGKLTHIPWQGSSDVPALAKANVFLIADHDRESWSAGDIIRVMAKP